MIMMLMIMMLMMLMLLVIMLLMMMMLMMIMMMMHLLVLMPTSPQRDLNKRREGKVKAELAGKQDRVNTLRQEIAENERQVRDTASYSTFKPTYFFLLPNLH